MARLAYYAPGVYVEEIPSARQPIAGVGTNTAGFIGIVPDFVYIPVPNPDYDPVLTRDLLEFARLTASAPEDDAGAAQQRQGKLQGELQQRLDVLAAEIAALTEQKAEADAKTKAAEVELKAAQDAQAALPAAAPDEQKNNAAAALSKAQKKLGTLKQKDASADSPSNLLLLKSNLRQDIRAQLDAAANPAAAVAAAAVAVEEEIDDYLGGDPDPVLLQRSVLRPYYLVKVRVEADEFATKLCTNFSEYAKLFGDFSAFVAGADGSTRPLSPGHHLLTHAVSAFFLNGGTRLFVSRIRGVEGLSKALGRFASIEDVAILAAPGLPKINDVWEELQSYCEDDAHQNVFAILDAPAVINDGQSNDFDIQQLQEESLQRVLPRKSSHAAYYLPHVEVNCPAKRLQDSDPAWNVVPRYRGRTYVAPSGHVAGIYARTDEERGVHKAPANALVRGALEVKYYISKPKQELLNPGGVNCIRLINGGVTVWGARTIGGDRNGEWKYVSVRRFAGFLEESIDRGTQWVVFEPNDPKLWSKIILNVTAFLTNVWRSGALFGLTAQEAFYVKCDAELNPPEVRDLGQVITEIGVAIVRPAEFVIFRVSQSTGLQPA